MPESSSFESSSSETNSAFSSLLAPLRQAQSLLGDVGQTAQSLVENSLFGEAVTALTSVPDIARYSPLQSSKQLPVDIPPTTLQGVVSAIADATTGVLQDFTDGLTQKARNGSGRGNAAGKAQAGAGGKPKESGAQGSNAQGIGAAGAKAAAGASASNANAASTTAISKGQSRLAQAEASAKDASSASGSNEPALLGSWGALEQIAELVNQVETAAENRLVDTGNAMLHGLESLFSKAPARTNAGAAATDRHAAPQKNASAGAPGKSTAQGQAGESAMQSILQSLVNASWQPEDGGPFSQGVSGRGNSSRSNASRGAQAEAATQSSPIAPRSPSMLNPQGGRPGSGNASATTPVVSGSGSSGNPTTSASDRTQTAPSSTSVISDDELAERLNRALLEQAWRGGVDLT